MTTLVVHDSAYGNTGKIAAAIGVAVPGSVLYRIGEVDPANLPRATCLIVGSPTQGGQATKAMQAWLAGIPSGALTGIKVAAFDTRFAAKEHGFALRLLMGVIGFAAPRILDALRAKGGQAAAEPEGFIVEGREGPLRDGELVRAAAWAHGLVTDEQQAA